ncbi:Pleckstriny domain-containing family M member 3-like, partial [Homarus americanus]
PTAFLRDPERGDIMLRVLQPISSLTFNLATNAAVLNTWTQTPLVLAGLWAPNVQVAVSDPILAATDVASTVYDGQTTNVNSNVFETPISDQMFDMIIGGTPETSFISDYMEKHKPSAKFEDVSTPGETEQDLLEKPKDAQGTDKKEKNESTVSGKSERDVQDHKKPEVVLDEDSLLANQNNQFENSCTSTLSSKGYVREWSEDSLSRSVIEGAPEYDKLFSDFGSIGLFPSVPGLAVADLEPSSSSTSTPSVEVSNESSLSDIAEKLNYEILPHQLPSEEDTSRLLPLLTRLTSEEGLDSQQYQCHQCKSYIGMIYGKPRVCSYDSKYYCYECHEDEAALIPARIVHNWDLSAHPVCTTNARWLAAIQNQPLIDLRTVNPKLYCHVDDLAEMQMLRTQLLYVRAYLFTCRSGVGEQLRKILWPSEHMYEHVHLYSVSDLQLVSTGQLVPRVRQAVTFGREHINGCEVCSPRGFICELCTDNEIIVQCAMECTMPCVPEDRGLVLVASGEQPGKKEIKVKLVNI